MKVGFMMEEKRLNKGLEIRNKKRLKNKEKMYKVKEEQINVERIVKVKYTITKLINGKWKTKTFYGIGNQKKNKVYFEDGKFIFINRKGVTVEELLDNDICLNDKKYKRVKQD